MEQHLDRAASAVMKLAAALDQYESAQPSVEALRNYYGSATWKQDFVDDEGGRLPSDLKRGVLSEDGIWNLVADCRELDARLRKLGGRADKE